jgi:hypothetical protein
MMKVNVGLLDLEVSLLIIIGFEDLKAIRKSLLGVNICKAYMMWMTFNLQNKL